MTHIQLIEQLKRIVKYTVTGLAMLMTFVILWSALDVVFLLYNQLLMEPFLRIGGEHMLAVFGSFLTVLIAIEIFLNIILYLTKDVFHVQLVVATALTAIARKVIVLDYNMTPAAVMLAIAAIVLAVGVCYWITNQSESRKKPIEG
jgi:uncharacterized membrane protein (DUF373 family)